MPTSTQQQTLSMLTIYSDPFQLTGINQLKNALPANSPRTRIGALGFSVDIVHLQLPKENLHRTRPHSLHEAILRVPSLRR